MRSVSATRASGASAGWQQVKIEPQPVVGERFGGLGLSSSSSGVRSASSASSSGRLAARVRSRRRRSIALLRATRVIQAPGIVRYAVDRPALERDDERLLHRLLGGVEVAEDADQGRDRPSRLVPEQAVDDDLIALRARLRGRGGSSAPNAS